MLVTITPNVITGPVKEPVTVAEAKSALRIDHSADDTLLGIYIDAARRVFELKTGRTIHQQTLEIVLDSWPAGDSIELPRATPLIAIVSAKYREAEAADYTTWASTNYIEDMDSKIGQLVLGYNKSWPSATLYPVSPIKIRYNAGIVTASPVTEASGDIKTPIFLLVGGMYENRESEVVTDRARIEASAFQFGLNFFIQHNMAAYGF